jgi:hypothetical protein
MLLLLFATFVIGVASQQPCSENTFASGSNGCTPCQTGSYSIGGTSTSCTPCSNSNQYWNGTACVTCVPGTKNTGSACVSCLSTEYSTNGTSCLTSPAGFFVDSARTTIQKCIAGSYSNEGAISCITCSPGSFSPADGSVNCTSCPIGSYASMPAMTSCTRCGLYLTTLSVGQTSKRSCVKSHPPPPPPPPPVPLKPIPNTLGDGGLPSSPATKYPSINGTITIATTNTDPSSVATLLAPPLASLLRVRTDQLTIARTNGRFRALSILQYTFAFSVEPMTLTQSNRVKTTIVATVFPTQLTNALSASTNGGMVVSAVVLTPMHPPPGTPPLHPPFAPPDAPPPPSFDWSMWGPIIGAISAGLMCSLCVGVAVCVNDSRRERQREKEDDAERPIPVSKRASRWRS